MPTDYRSMYDKDFIGAWDLADGDKTITITRVKGGELTAPGGRKSKKPVIYFNGSEKGFALNSTNGKTIASLYGNYTEDWIGKSITLYKSTTRSPQGDGDVECIRVRPHVPKTAAPAARHPLHAESESSDRIGSPPDAAAPFTDDEIIEKLCTATDTATLEEYAELARSISDREKKKEARDAYNATLQRLKEGAAA